MTFVLHSALTLITLTLGFPPTDSDDVNSTSRLDQKKGERHLGDPSVSLLKALYAECLDLLIVSSENGNICK